MSANSEASVMDRGVDGHSFRAYTALVGGVICISFTAIFTKWADVPGPVSAAYRMAIAAVVLTIPFLRERRMWTGDARRDVRWGVLGGLWFAFNLALLNSALLLTSAATATLLDNSAPIWVGLGAMIFFRERLALPYWFGLLLALAGAATVTGISLSAATAPNAGDVLALIGAFFYAGYLLTTQRARQNLSPLSYLWIAAATSAVVLVVASLVLRMPLLGHSWRTYGALLAVGLVSQTGGWLLINYSLGVLPASTAVVILLAQPVITGVLAIPLLGEVLTLKQMVGGALELSGIYVCLRQERMSGAISKWASRQLDRWTSKAER